MISVLQQLSQSQSPFLNLSHIQNVYRADVSYIVPSTPVHLR